MLFKLNTVVYLLEYPPPPSLQWEIEQIKTGGTENQQWRTLFDKLKALMI